MPDDSARPPADHPVNDRVPPPRPDATASLPEKFATLWGTDQLWRDLFDAAPIAYGLVDLETREIFANAAYRELFGFGPGERITTDDVTHPENRNVTERFFSAIRDGRIRRTDGEGKMRRRDGSVFEGKLTMAVLCDSHDAPVAMLAAVEDVTERVEAHRALAQSEARWRALVQNAADSILVLGADGHLLYASPSGGRLTGVSADEWVGEDALGFVHPDDHEVVATAFANTAAQAGAAVPLRFRILNIDGSTRFVEAVATNLLDEPAVGGIVVNLRDLTDAEEAQTALEVSENRYRRMLENISDTVTLLDDTGMVIATTGNVKSILGYPTEFWTARNAFEICHPDDLDRLRTAFVELLEDPGSEQTGEFRVRDANGEWVHVEISGVNLLDDVDVRAMVLTTRNVSSRKQFELELQQARDDAVRALETRTEFIASVSHELRTPIHGILGLTELLLTSELDDEARSLTRSIGRATDSLRMVLDDILDFSKIEVGRLEINRLPIRVGDVVDDLHALFGPQARAKGIDLRIEVDDDIPEWVVGDGLRVRQVMTNLVGNALKFTSSGGVTVHTYRLPRAPGERVDYARIDVRDTGIGIPAEAQARLFEPFSQAHRTTAREFGGTGLGLSITKRLIELMGGALGLESEPGVGSLFWFTLPMVAGESPGERAEPTSSTELARVAPGDHVRVMVVEDNAINQLLVRRQLDRLGYESEVIASGFAALDSLADPEFDPVDAVLMDWQLPGIDGLETTRRLRTFEAERGRGRLPVIAMTASALPGDRARCFDAGMDDFIAKPVSIVTLGNILSRWTGRGSAASVGGADASDRPAIEAGVLDKLVEELADPGLVATVVRTYLRELDGRVGAITAAIDRGDRLALTSTAHTLKSTSAAVGAEDLAESCRRLEETASVSSTAPLPVSASDLRRQAAAVHHALDGEVERLLAEVPVPGP